MIYNGFQARILDIHHEPLAEMMPEVIKEKVKTNTNEEIQLANENQQWDMEEFQSILGEKAVESYHSNLRQEAIKNVRCGAVRVKVDGNEESNEGEIEKIDEKKIKFNLLNQQTKRSTHLFLAFRWVGTDHRNAQRAHELDELQNTFFPVLYGHGLQGSQSSTISSKNQKDQNLLKEDGKDLRFGKKLVKLLHSKNKAKDKNVGNDKVTLFKNPSAPSQRKSFSLRARKNAISSHPFLMQLYVDGKPISIRKEPWTDEKDESNGAMIVWMSDGALVDLGRLDIDINDFKGINNKHVRSITLHLWDGMRKELWNNAVTFTMKGDSGLVHPTCDIKEISAPNAILHFNVIAFKELQQSPDSSSKQLAPIPSISTSSGSEDTIKNDKILRTPPILDEPIARINHALTVVNESSQENIASEISKNSADIKAGEDIPVISEKTEDIDTSIAKAANTFIEKEIQKGEIKRSRVPSIQNRQRTTSLQASFVSTSHDEVYSPIRSIFEEVDRLRFEHEQLKSSMKHLDGQWRDSVVNELHRLRGEIRERIDLDKAHYDKVRRRFSLPQQPEPENGDY